MTIYDQKTNELPTGLFDSLWDIIKREQTAHPELKVELDDRRGKPIKPKVPNSLQLSNGDDDPIILFEHQQKAVEYAIKHQTGVIDIATNGGKCVTADTRVLTPSGYFTVQQLFENQGFSMQAPEGVVYTPKNIWLVNAQGAYERPDYFTVNGKRDVCQVSTQEGRQETMTANHPLLVKKAHKKYPAPLTRKDSPVLTDSIAGQFYDWVPLQDLEVGDYVLTLETYGQPDHFNDTDDYTWYWDKVTSIEFQGQQPTFDVSMPQTHSFIAEGIVNHNTEVAAGVIKLDLPLLNSCDDIIMFLCQSKDIAHQTQKRLEKRLEIPVGLWGDGEKDIKKVTVAMVGTVSAALKDPTKDVKLTSKKDKIIAHMATDYVPLFLSKPNIKLTIKAFLQSNTPKYSYDRDIHDTLRDMLGEIHDERKLKKALEWYPKQYHKLIEKKNKKGIEKYDEAKEILNRVRVIITDESHHSVADTYQLVYHHLPNARQRIGLTGTVPSPTEDPIKYTKFIGNFSKARYRVTNDEMIDKGISAKPIISMVPITQPTNLDELVDQELPQQVPKNQEALLKYQAAYRIGIVENDYRNQVIGNLVGKLQEASPEPVLIVVNSIEHGEIIQEHLPEGLTSEFLQGSKTAEERTATINRVKSGQTQVLIGTQMIDEGIDLPNLKFLIYASGGKSNRQLLQRVGRMLRISPDKHTVRIFDMQDCTNDLLFKQAKHRLSTYKREKFEVLGSK
ncbi:helicase-related protein [Secundilactobacillus kimchicus]|uniref:helicase-related protein n=1 Tax=Secundilactobacillus kimchicus TaxID=528209 RepID=UPI001C0342CF